MHTIYLDNNSTTPVLPAVWEAMFPFFSDIPGNPASSHFAGRKARQALENARQCTAQLLGAAPDEVIFTSGATEANNLALFGLAAVAKWGDGEVGRWGDGEMRRWGDEEIGKKEEAGLLPTSPPPHLLLSAVEHPCVTEPAEQLGRAGFAVEGLPVDAVGRVQPAALRERLRDETRLVCVMLANHETGTIQPIRELAGDLPKEVKFHCDAAAAAGKIPIHFHELGVTSLTVSAHKLHGPKGVGALLLRSGTRLQPLLFGGHQQNGKRPGTEPVALAVGLAKALELAVAEMEQRRSHVLTLRRVFVETLRQQAAPVIVNGSEEGGIPHALNVSFPGCSSDVLLMNLDLAGVACSTGSACSSGSLLPSPVLQAMQVPDEVLHSAMRFSFSHLLTEAEVLDAAQRIGEVVRRMRAAAEW